MTHPGLMGATQPGTLAFLERNSPAEVILAGGAAKVKNLDRQFLDRYISQVGERAARRERLNLLEADWVATDKALYYISPRVGQGCRYPWAHILSLVIVKQRWRFATVAIQLPRDVVTIKVSRSSANVLHEIYAELRWSNSDADDR
jgi:hypothetical protein